MQADTLVEWKPDIGWQGINADEWSKLKWAGLDVPLEEITRMEDGSFEYKGQKVIVYIRDQYTSHRYGNKRYEYKFHVAWCDVLQRMSDERRYQKRYVVTVRRDGKFIVNLFERSTVIAKDKEIEMKVCMMCLAKLKYNGYPTNRYEIYRQFTVQQFFDKYETKIPVLPRYTDTTAPLNAYSQDFERLSYEFRKSKNWICDNCGSDFRNNKKRLHTHHIDFDKSNNRLDNLMAFCDRCHAKQPGHQHMRRLDLDE